MQKVTLLQMGSKLFEEQTFPSLCLTSALSVLTSRVPKRPSDSGSPICRDADNAGAADSTLVGIACRTALFAGMDVAGVDVAGAVHAGTLQGSALDAAARGQGTHTAGFRLELRDPAASLNSQSLRLGWNMRAPQP